MIFFDLVSSTGVARPVKVEKVCLLKAPVMITSGLPPALQIEDSAALRLASVKARWVPSVRVPVPSAADASAPPAPFWVFDFTHERIEARLRAVVALPVFFAWLVPTRIDSMSRLSSR